MRTFTKDDLRLAYYGYGLENEETSFEVWYEKNYPEPTSDEKILEYYGWECVCKSPYELQHFDGSFASGSAAYYLMESLRSEYNNE